jgi:hypothetical protein
MLYIGYREDGAQLDKIYITKYSEAPSGVGDEAINCESPQDTITSSIAVRFNEMKRINSLMQNYPNPLSVSTSIKYNIGEPDWVNLKVYDLRGQEIEILVNKYQEAGEHEIIWSPNDLANGIYLYRLQVGEFIDTKKIIIQN